LTVTLLYTRQEVVYT